MFASPLAPDQPRREPTTGLDGAVRDRLLGPFPTLMEGRTTIVVSHGPAAIGPAPTALTD